MGKGKDMLDDIAKKNKIKKFFARVGAGVLTLSTLLTGGLWLKEKNNSVDKSTTEISYTTDVSNNDTEKKAVEVVTENNVDKSQIERIEARKQLFADLLTGEKQLCIGSHEIEVTVEDGSKQKVSVPDFTFSQKWIEEMASILGENYGADVIVVGINEANEEEYINFLKAVLKSDGNEVDIDKAKGIFDGKNGVAFKFDKGLVEFGNLGNIVSGAMSTDAYKDCEFTDADNNTIASKYGAEFYIQNKCTVVTQVVTHVKKITKTNTVYEKGEETVVKVPVVVPVTPDVQGNPNIKKEETTNDDNISTDVDGANIKVTHETTTNENTGETSEVVEGLDGDLAIIQILHDEGIDVWFEDDSNPIKGETIGDDNAPVDIDGSDLGD